MEISYPKTNKQTKQKSTFHLKNRVRNETPSHLENFCLETMGCYTKFSMAGVGYFFMGISSVGPLDSRLEIWSIEFSKAM